MHFIAVFPATKSSVFIPGLRTDDPNHPSALVIYSAKSVKKRSTSGQPRRLPARPRVPARCPSARSRAETSAPSGIPIAEGANVDLFFSH